LNKSTNKAKEKTMKNKILLAILAIALVLGMSSCKDSGGDDSTTVTPPPAEITSAKGIELRLIPAGTFTMGSPETEADRYSDEIQHSVTLTKSFYMGKYQVTQEQYQTVMGSNPSSFTSAVDGESGTPGKLPVEQVSWYDAIVFCNKLSISEGLSPVYSISGSTDPTTWGTVPISSNATWNAVVTVSGANGYRLPTEAEWEYACRAGTTTAWYTGNTEDGTPHLNTAAWYSNNAGSKTHQVGLKTPNAWGLYDMHGNVWEWCWDWFGDYASGAQTDPAGAVTGTYRVGRGGSWNFVGQNLRSAFRSYYYPNYGYYALGFRLVRS
jgi:formylglycine-generating enzyme required for sulfatase activity